MLSAFESIYFNCEEIDAQVKEFLIMRFLNLIVPIALLLPVASGAFALASGDGPDRGDQRRQAIASLVPGLSQRISGNSPSGGTTGVSARRFVELRPAAGGTETGGANYSGGDGNPFLHYALESKDEKPGEAKAAKSTVSNFLMVAMAAIAALAVFARRDDA